MKKEKQNHKVQRTTCTSLNYYLVRCNNTRNYSFLHTNKQKRMEDEQYSELKKQSIACTLTMSDIATTMLSVLILLVIVNNFTFVSDILFLIVC